MFILGNLKEHFKGTLKGKGNNSQNIILERTKTAPNNKNWHS